MMTPVKIAHVTLHSPTLFYFALRNLHCPKQPHSYLIRTVILTHDYCNPLIMNALSFDGYLIEHPRSSNYTEFIQLYLK